MIRAFRVYVGVGLLLAAAQSAGAADPAADAKPAELRIGLLKPMFKDVPSAMVNAAARPLQSMIVDKSGMKGSVEVVEDYKALAEKLSTGKLDIGVFHGFEYAWVKDTPGLIPLVATVPTCGKVQACLVVSVDSTFTDVKDLKGACVVLPTSSKAHCHMYLERLRERLPAGDCCPAKNRGLTPEAALGEVANGEADAALVDVSSLIALERALPGCYKKLRVLAQSEQLPPAVVVYRKDSFDAATVTRIRNGLLDCSNTGPGRLFSMFWQLKGFEDVTASYHTLVATAAKAYPAPGGPVPPAAPSAPNPLPNK
ncbi:phosphate/phosphite/phosphonate ABC transporter substrate-binding protein [Gemmata sp.]|uniref:phosphate/phosphite/phosphonate ABC transporter substrate-binding protein n=1 Tax=Gemmata sp. TaxID=1914242 RepID=UPI003F718A18